MHFTSEINHTSCKFLYPSSHTEVNRRAKISNQCQEREHEWRQWKLPEGNLNCSCSFVYKRTQPKLVFGQLYPCATEVKTNETFIYLQCGWVKMNTYPRWLAFSFKWHRKEWYTIITYFRVVFQLYLILLVICLQCDWLWKLFVKMNSLLLCSWVFVLTTKFSEKRTYFSHAHFILVSLLCAISSTKLINKCSW